jgi:hypothetical protein
VCCFIRCFSWYRIEPDQRADEETIKLGETNPGKKIFETALVKSAIFGNWPNYGGGLIKTKLMILL